MDLIKEIIEESIARMPMPEILKTKLQSRDALLLTVIVTDYIRHAHVKMLFEPESHYAENIAYGQKLHDMMADSPFLANVPHITDLLEAYQTAIDGFTAAEVKASMGYKTDKTALKTYSSNFIKVTSERFRELVQGICDGNSVQCLQIAESCGMSLKAIGKKDPQDWSVENGEISGDVIMTADISGYNKVVHSINWQRCPDPSDPTTWYLMENEILGTTQATNTIHGLKKGATYYFRYRIIHPEGVTAWSVTLSLIIL